MTSEIWRPPAQVQRELETRRQHEGELMEQMEMLGTAKEWNKLLREVDPYLELVKAKDDAEIPPLKPGYWHLLRHSPTAPPSVIPLDGPDGEYRDPGSWVLDRLRHSDLWSDELQRDRSKLEQRAERAKERRQARESEERIEEVRDRFTALEPSVSMTKAGPWSYRASAKKRRSTDG